MSRSYKKHPIVTCAKDKNGKKFANKKVRNIEEIGNNNNYKRHYCSWNICDYKEFLKHSDLLKLDEWWKSLGK